MDTTEERSSDISFILGRPFRVLNRFAARLGWLGLVSCCAAALYAPVVYADDTIVALLISTLPEPESDLPPPPLVLALLSDGSGGDLGSMTPTAVEGLPFVRERGVAPRAGLMVGFGGVQQPVRADVVYRVHDLFAFGGSLAGIPSDLGSALLSMANVPNGALSSLSADGSLYCFPARDSFFLGVSAGALSLSASSASGTESVAVEAHEVYITPRLGWLATWESGFTFGFDLGMQIPLSSSVLATGSRAVAASNAESVARTLVEMTLPTLSMRLGWLL